jgi:hypothetical protein
MQQKSKMIQIYKIEYKLPLQPSHKGGKYQFPPQNSKVRSIKGFGENISQLSPCINISHLNIFLLNMVSQEVVSPLKVSHSFVKTGFFATEMALMLSHMRGTLLKITPKSLMVCTIHRIWEQQLYTQPL